VVYVYAKRECSPPPLKVVAVERDTHSLVRSGGEPARAPGVGQNADKMWAQMPNSPRLLETIDATVRNTPALCGPASPHEASEINSGSTSMGGVRVSKPITHPMQL